MVLILSLSKDEDHARLLKVGTPYSLPSAACCT